VHAIATRWQRKALLAVLLVLLLAVLLAVLLAALLAVLLAALLAVLGDVIFVRARSGALTAAVVTLLLLIGRVCIT
jgi:lipopolysaccharide/colanic/teichoic acid biosynthesis glycosyltransferase